MTNRVRKLMFAILSSTVLAVGGAGPAALSAVAATPGPLATFVFSPSPIGASGTLTPGTPVTVTVTAKDAAGTPIPGASAWLALFAATATTSGSAVSQTKTLTTNPSATPVTADSNGQFTIDYTPGDATGGKDVLQAQNASTSPTVKVTDTYRYFGGSYTFTPNPIAGAGSVGSAQAVSGKVCVLDAAKVAIPGASAWLSFVAAAGSNGSAVAGNGTSTALTGTPAPFTADGSGCIAWTYTGPTAPPSIGEDILTVQDWPDHVGVLQTDRYAFGATYTALAGPTRIVDSRTGLGLAAPLGEGPGRSQSIQVTGLTGPVPKAATAITGNLTVTGQTGAGFVTLSPTKPSVTPATSTINFPLKDNRANGVTADLGSTGKLWVTYISASSSATVDIILDVTGYFTADTTGSTYHPLAGPVRIVDSRTGLNLATKLTDGVPKSFQVTGFNGDGIPAGATAITGNLTVTGQTDGGYVALTTTAESSPPTSTINFPVGDNRANGVITPLGAGGALWAVYKSTTGATTQLVFDVTGYFTADATGASYVPLVPARVLDTRSSIGLSGPFHSHVARTFQVTGQGGVPSFATAITGNLTVTEQTAAGFAALDTVATNSPSTSTLNFPVGDNRANGVTTPLGGSGTLSATYGAAASTDTTALILDVTGYYH